MAIYIRVEPNTQPYISMNGIILESTHPSYNKECPVCDKQLGALPLSLVFIGRDPKIRSTWTGNAVAVHDECTGL